MLTYNKEEILEKALEIIEKHKLFFVEDLIAYLPCNKSTFYKLIPATSDEMEPIKEALDNNKILTKVKLRRDWQAATAPALQLALYKLIGTKDELRSLSMQHLDHTTDGKPIGLTREERDAKIAKIQTKINKNGVNG
jgi:hypothetical protein